MNLPDKKTEEILSVVQLIDSVSNKICSKEWCAKWEECTRQINDENYEGEMLQETCPLNYLL